MQEKSEQIRELIKENKEDITLLIGGYFHARTGDRRGRERGRVRKKIQRKDTDWDGKEVAKDTGVDGMVYLKLKNNGG